MADITTAKMRRLSRTLLPSTAITYSCTSLEILQPSYFKLIREKGPFRASEDIPLSSIEPTNTHEYIVSVVKASTSINERD